MNSRTYIQLFTLAIALCATHITRTMELYQLPKLAEAQSFFTTEWSKSATTLTSDLECLNKTYDNLLRSAYFAYQTKTKLNLAHQPQLLEQFKKLPEKEQTLFQPYVTTSRSHQYHNVEMTKKKNDFIAIETSERCIIL